MFTEFLKPNKMFLEKSKILVQIANKMGLKKLFKLFFNKPLIYVFLIIDGIKLRIVISFQSWKN
jgi:hypothetical protein